MLVRGWGEWFSKVQPVAFHSSLESAVWFKGQALSITVSGMKWWVTTQDDKCQVPSFGIGLALAVAAGAFCGAVLLLECCGGDANVVVIIDTASRFMSHGDRDIRTG